MRCLALWLNALSRYGVLGAVPGDCTLVKDGNKYNFCILAIRRTVYTNLDRVFTMQFLARDSPVQCLFICFHWHLICGYHLPRKAKPPILEK
jgi:hypothetical protein